MTTSAVKAKATMVLNQIEHTEDELFGYDKHGNHFNIEREPDGRFYIQVTWKEGGHLYDGWWNQYGKTMREAVIEAVEGACLVSERATQPAAHGMDAQQYRLIECGELIEAGDQFLRDDFTWQIDPQGIFVGMPHGAALRPARRSLAAQAKQGEKQ